MIANTTRAVYRHIQSYLDGGSARFLRNVSGVIHVGANTGQERKQYARYGLRVIWLEPIPDVFDALQANLADFPMQHAFQYLLSDQDDLEYDFHVASNGGASSSILDLKLHSDVWPDVVYDGALTLRSKTLVSVLNKEHIVPDEYDALVMDTQGSELLVLKGSRPLLPHFRYIKTEVPDFESYSGCCQLAEIASFLAENGYSELSRHRFARRAKGGSYFDVVYERTSK